jgi:hypothetical protein
MANERTNQGRNNDRGSERRSGSGGDSGRMRASASGGSSGESRSERESLREREYKDSQGNVHHHTRTYMEQHDKK